jgi:hypothetical protein
VCLNAKKHGVLVNYPPTGIKYRPSGGPANLKNNLAETDEVSLTYFFSSLLVLLGHKILGLLEIATESASM